MCVSIVSVRGLCARVAMMALCALLMCGPWGRLAAYEGEAGSRRTAVVEVVDRLSPAVVNISTDIYESRPANPFFGMQRDPFFDDFFNQFFGPSGERRQKRQSLGSGVLVDKKGRVLTNHHVILRASEIHVTLVSGKEYKGELVGSDPSSDLAVVKIAAKSPAMIRLAKEALNGIEDGNLEDKYRSEQGFTLEAYTTKDSQEARDAFVQKRDAKFEG